MKPINLKFCAPFKILYRNGRDSLNKKTIFDFSLLYPRKNGLSRKSKVCPLDTQIKYSGFRISDSKVFSTGIGNQVSSVKTQYRYETRYIKPGFKCKDTILL